MKSRFVLPLLALSLLASCERSSPTINAEDERRRAEEARALDDRIARLQEMEDRLAAREAAETEAERAKLVQEKERLKAERDALADSRDKANAEAARAKREARDAAERAEQAAARADNERADAQLDFFYTALEPHGEWLEVDGLGFCWQPGVAERRGWRPYTDGRWVFTEYGWTWKSNEPFGWATYHYGRWTKLQRIGWIWVPATEWGPAWVSWRRSDDFIGWAPLPPDAWSASGFTAAVDSYYDIGPGSYTFVPVETLGADTYVGQVVEPEQNITIINKTVNVTNVTYKTVKNVNVVYNAGPDLERVNRRALTKIPQLKVERVANIQDGPRATSQEGGVLRMTAPRFEQGNGKEGRPKRIKERVKEESADRGWSGFPDRKGVEQVRERNRREARQAESQQRSGRREEAPAATPATPAPAVPKATPRPSQPDRDERPRAGKPAPATPVATPRERRAVRGSREEPNRAVPAEVQPDAPVRPAEPTNTPADDRGERTERDRSNADRPRRGRQPDAQAATPAEAGRGRTRPDAATPIPSATPRKQVRETPVEGSSEPPTPAATEAPTAPPTAAGALVGAEPVDDEVKTEIEAPPRPNPVTRRVRVVGQDATGQPATPAPAAPVPAAVKREEPAPATSSEVAPVSEPESPITPEPPVQQSEAAAEEPDPGQAERRRPRAERARPANRAEENRGAERNRDRRPSER